MYSTMSYSSRQKPSNGYVMLPYRLECVLLPVVTNILFSNIHSNSRLWGVVGCVVRARAQQCTCMIRSDLLWSLQSVETVVMGKQ